MKVVAAISSPVQDDVIERILRHLGWDPPWKAERNARAPPRQSELFSNDSLCQLRDLEEEDIKEDVPTVD